MANDAAQYLNQPDQLHEDTQQWLRPLGPIRAFLHCSLCFVASCLLRSLFRIRVVGRQLVPAERPVIFAPTHQSSLDAPLLAID